MAYGHGTIERTPVPVGGGRHQVAIRKLYWPKASKPSEMKHLDVAELILKWGMMNHPQSTYLQVNLSRPTR